ncbi:MAG: FAD:protein FMN transferase [Bacteroidaceae bacterium]|nr:FAD:protein FMN transferase [Bacteroidaceae bacterium]
MSDPLNPIDPDQKFDPLTPADAPKSQWRRWHLPVLALFAIASYLIITRRNAPAPYQKDEGAVFGTFYHITYQSRQQLKDSIEAQLKAVDQSLSMFNPTSTISRINSGESTQTDSLFRTVFRLAQQVSADTRGAFDITVAPLVNAWGFGFKNGTLPDSAAVDSLRTLIGWQRVSLSTDGSLRRDDPRIILDCSAIAKGFGVDVVANYLRAQGIVNYMVEIGGEVVVSGVNPKGEPWHVGINRPIDDPESTASELDTILAITDCAMATSGNYRNFYTTEDGRRVAHTIDPATGYPVQHSILSATVLAPTCAQADAFATSFMVMGLDSARAILARHPELSAYLIYDSLANYRTYSTIVENQ